MFKCLNDKMMKCRGFTLVEILVSIFIIMLMAGIIFANYRQGGKQFALQRSANKLAQDMRRIEEMAMSAKEFGGSIPQGGYGIYLDLVDPDSYILFANSNGNCSYDSGVDELVENPNFEPGVKIDFLAIYAADEFFAVLDSKLTIILTPPDPKVTICNYPLADSAFAISTIDGRKKTVSMNLTGLVEIDPVLPPCVCTLWSSFENLSCGGSCGPEQMEQESTRICYDVPPGSCVGVPVVKGRCTNDYWEWGLYKAFGIPFCCCYPCWGGPRTQHKSVGTPHYGCLPCPGVISVGDCPSIPGNECVALPGECAVQCQSMPAAECID